MFVDYGLFFVCFLRGDYVSDNDSFGGKLKKVLASVCSMVVGASSISQAKN